MQIVIEIEEAVYKECMPYKDSPIISNLANHNAEIIHAIANGTPLPKHGRLIDADEAIKTLKSIGNRDYRRGKGTIQEAEKMLSFDEYTPTIIEAYYKAESEGEE